MKKFVVTWNAMEGVWEGLGWERDGWDMRRKDGKGYGGMEVTTKVRQVTTMLIFSMY